jgi:Tfp pilus assembly protein PilZ
VRKAMEKNRRTGKRLTLRNTIYFGPHRPPAHTSFIKDLSNKGVGVKTDRAFEPGTKIYMAIEADYKIYGAEGVVVWSKRITPGLVQLVKTDMGIKFTHVDHELVNFYEEKIKEDLVEHGL